MELYNNEEVKIVSDRENDENYSSEESYQEKNVDPNNGGEENSDNSDNSFSIISKSIIVNDAARIERINQVNVDFGEDSPSSCPLCHAPIDTKEYGKISCKNCGTTLFRRNKNQNIGVYGTITDTADAKNFTRILHHIQNKLIERNYKEAYNFCLQAEKIAPAEPTTWSNFARIVLLKELSVKINDRKKSAKTIAEQVKIHLKKCKNWGMGEKEYEVLTGELANDFFYRERAKLLVIKASQKDYFRNDKWTRDDLELCLLFLKSYEWSYSLYPNILYLEEYLNELSKPYKWLVKDSNGDLKKTFACGSFNAVDQYKFLLDKVRSVKPDFPEPEIAQERLDIIDPDFIEIIG